MKPEDWERIDHFGPGEKWGDASMMRMALLLPVDQLRGLAETPAIVHAGYAIGGHSRGSYHYFGMAVDLHLVGLSLLEQYLLAERVGFGGIGCYPFWSSPGLHLDIRPPQFHYRWWRDEQGEYHPLTKEAFREAARGERREARGR